MSPSLLPTYAAGSPTPQPSSAPSSKPTLQPTPTSEHTVAFTAFQMYDGFSCDTYQALESTIQQIIAGTVVSVLDNAVTPSDVAFSSYSAMQQIRARKLKAGKGGSSNSGSSSSTSHHTKDSSSVTDSGKSSHHTKDSSSSDSTVDSTTTGHFTTTVTASTTDTFETFTDGADDFDGNEDDDGEASSANCIITYTVAYTDDYTYDLLSGELIKSVDGGLFNTILHFVASQFDIDAENVTSPWVSTYDYAATSSPTSTPPTASPTAYPSTTPQPTPTSYTSIPTTSTTPTSYSAPPTPTSYTQIPTLLPTFAPSEEPTTQAPSPVTDLYTAGPTYTKNIFFADQVRQFT